MSLIIRYAKAFASVGVTLAAGVASYWTDGVSPTEWSLIAGLGLTSLGVAVVPNIQIDNMPLANWVKSILAFFAAGNTALVAVIAGGVNTPELLTVLIAAFAAVGVVARVGNAKNVDGQHAAGEWGGGPTAAGNPHAG